MNPMFSGFSYGDWTSGGTSSAAILIAIFHKKSTGEGQFIDLAGRKALIANVGNIIMDYTLNRRVEERMGNDQPYSAPHGCYRCKGDDNWINIAVGDDEQWAGFCRVIGNPDWCRQEKFSNSINRWKNRSELDKLVEGWTILQDKFEITESLQKAAVPAGAVLSIKEVNLNSQLIDRGFFSVIDHGEGIGERPLPISCLLNIIIKKVLSRKEPLIPGNNTSQLMSIERCAAFACSRASFTFEPVSSPEVVFSGMAHLQGKR